MKLTVSHSMKYSAYTTILILLLVCLTSFFAAKDLNTPSGNAISFFDGPALEKKDSSVNLDDASLSSLNKIASRYKLICAENGESTAFSKDMSRRYHCDPEGHVGSSRVIDPLCDDVCRCYGAQFGEFENLSRRETDEKIDRDSVDSSIGTVESPAIELTPRPSLEKRHNYALVCDRPPIKQEQQRTVTGECQAAPYHYSCNRSGGKTFITRNDRCDYYCRCVNLEPACVLKPEMKPLWAAMCKAAKVLTTQEVHAAQDDSTSLSEADQAKDTVDVSKKAIESTEMEPTSIGRLGKRHNYALVCDRPPIKQDEQRRVTILCQSWPISYVCNTFGKKAYVIQNDRCDYYCRCVNLEPACILKPESRPFWTAMCKGAKTLSAEEISLSPEHSTSVSQNDSAIEASSDSSSEMDHEADSSTILNGREETGDIVSVDNETASVPTLKCFEENGLTKECTDLNYVCTVEGLVQPKSGPSIDKCESACICVDLKPTSPSQTIDLVERHTDPNLSAWEAWCGHEGAFRDHQYEQWCWYVWFYKCNKDGTLQSAGPGVPSCNLRCICVQPSRWDGRDRRVPLPPGAADTLDESSTMSADENATDSSSDGFSVSNGARSSSTDSRRDNGVPYESHDVPVDLPFSQSQWGDSEDHPSNTDIEFDSPFSQSQWGDTVEENDRSETLMISSPIALDDSVPPNTDYPLCKAWVMYCAHFPDGKTSMRNYEFTHNCALKEFMRCSGEGVIYSLDGSDDNWECRKDCFCQWLVYNARICPMLEQTPPPSGSPTRGLVPTATTMEQRVKRSDRTDFVG